jgi:hypothetical protein
MVMTVERTRGGSWEVLVIDMWGRAAGVVQERSELCSRTGISS